MDVVDRFASRSVGLFAVVLVIIQFILESGSIEGYKLLAINALVLSGGFLMFTFILELWADIKILLFHLQLTSLRYSGLLLFLGLYYLLLANDLPQVMNGIFLIFLLVSWLAWILHELHYLLRTQLKNWRSREISRKDWIVAAIRRDIELSDDGDRVLLFL